jgi:uncharacterized membrane protein YoaK (UPF0700 family)
MGGQQQATSPSRQSSSLRSELALSILRSSRTAKYQRRLSYVTGTRVKMGQGIERHISGGSPEAWLGYLLLYVSFIVGGIIAGSISLVATGPQMLAITTMVGSLAAGYTYSHRGRRVLLRESASYTDHVRW